MMFFVVCHGKPNGIQRFEYEGENYIQLKNEIISHFKHHPTHKVECVEFWETGKIVDVYFSSKIIF